jgi:streptomycin 6-kinase
MPHIVTQPGRNRDLRRHGPLEEVTSNEFLTHADLHYGNVLAGDREPWLAIDPKPLAGDPEHSVPELLWARADEIEDAQGVRRLLTVIVENGALDAEKARRWAIVRAVDYWLWGLSTV